MNYNAISQVYDRVREADAGLIRRLLQGVVLDATTYALDIGCGTGDYADALQRLTAASIVGVDPSTGMLAQAQQKNARVDWRQGDAEHLPCDDGVFDFVYMTDVIHHVPHMDRMLDEVRRVLTPGGRACIVTQSHAQIAARPLARFFPATVAVDQARYPDIPAILAVATQQGLTALPVEVYAAGAPVTLDRRFRDLVAAKGYSMLHLVPAAGYQAGLAALDAALARGDLDAARAGETLVWLQK